MYFAHAKLCVAAVERQKKDYPGLKRHKNASLCARVLVYPHIYTVVYREEYMYNVFIGECVWENGWLYRFKNLENVYEKCQRF